MNLNDIANICRIRVETESFKPLPKEIKHSIELEAVVFGNFLEKKTEVFHNTD